MLPTEKEAGDQVDIEQAIKRVRKLAGQATPQSAIESWVKSVGAEAVLEATDVDIIECLDAF